MTSVLFDLGIFAAGLVVGVAMTLAALALARVRNRAARAGESLVRKLGPLGARRFFEVTAE